MVADVKTRLNLFFISKEKLSAQHLGKMAAATSEPVLIPVALNF
jgi:hypothetical protein